MKTADSCIHDNKNHYVLYALNSVLFYSILNVSTLVAFTAMQSNVVNWGRRSVPRAIPLSLDRAESNQAEAASDKQHFTGVLEGKCTEREMQVKVDRLHHC